MPHPIHICPRWWCAINYTVPTAGGAPGGPAAVPLAAMTLDMHFLKGPSWSVVARALSTRTAMAPAVPKIQAMMATPRVGPASIPVSTVVSVPNTGLWYVTVPTEKPVEKYEGRTGGSDKGETDGHDIYDKASQESGQEGAALKECVFPRRQHTSRTDSSCASRNNADHSGMIAWGEKVIDYYVSLIPQKIWLA